MVIGSDNQMKHQEPFAVFFWPHYILLSVCFGFLSPFVDQSAPSTGVENTADGSMKLHLAYLCYQLLKLGSGRDSNLLQATLLL